MADFAPVFDSMILNEGGYKLTNVTDDKGGPTYAGIARNRNPQWMGWEFLDRGETPPTELVRRFYRTGWWEPLQCDHINSQRIARTLFDFAVNTSAFGRPMVAAKLMQIVVGVAPDGFVGPKTLAALNAYHEELFMAQYALAKLARYRDIVTKDRSQLKFLLGWINRTLKEVA